MRRALITGASGLVGSCCQRRLLGSDNWDEVVSFVRRPSGTTHPRLREVLVDFNALGSLPDDNYQAETAFCCLGSTLKKAGSLPAQRLVDVEYVSAFGKFSLQQGVRHFLVVSSLGADPESASAYLRMKGEMEHQLSELGFPIVDVFQPSLLLGDRLEARPAESIAQYLFRLVDPLLHLLLPKYRAIAADKVAAAMEALAEQPQPGFHVHVSDRIPQLGGP